MNIVIPMAGEGSRFVKAGYEKPKPFIDVLGKPMIAHVLENVKYKNSRFYLLARKEHLDREQDLVKEIEKTYNAIFIPIDKLTEGTVCTVLHARKYINNASPLLIANSDQLVDMDITEYIEDCFNRKLSGSILTFIDKERNPKWSFAKIGSDSLVQEVREKVAISEYATVGIYLYAEGKAFVDAAIDMIIANDRVNNEFYTCPTYNYAIKNGGRFGIYNVKQSQMHGLGTPEDLNAYLKLRKAMI